MSKNPSTTPRRSAGIAASNTWRANSIAAHSAGFAGTSAARRAGLAAVAGLATVGVVAPAAHAEGYGPAGAQNVSYTATGAVSAPAQASEATTRITTVDLNVRVGPSIQSERITTLATGTEVTTTGTTVPGWTQINYNGAHRWVATRYLGSAAQGGSAPAGAKTATAAWHTTSAPVNTANLSAARAAIVKAAYSGIGSGYVYGGTSYGAWDCSGFTMWAYAKAGISLPRTSYAQAAALKHTSNPQPGDLVLQNGGSHIGIYVGNGMMISALNPSQGTMLHPVSWMPVSAYLTIS